MFKFIRRSKRPTVTRLDHVALSERCHEFEDRFAREGAFRLSSADFYDMYLRGDGDEIPYAMEWASYYEMLRKLGRRALEDQGATPQPSRRRSPITA
jgi:hypothetical protein